jgi:hypothetical protein
LGGTTHRKDKNPIPVPAILRGAKFLEPPSLDEGFDEFQIVKPEPNLSHKRIT